MIGCIRDFELQFWFTLKKIYFIIILLLYNKNTYIYNNNNNKLLEYIINQNYSIFLNGLGSHSWSSY